MYISEYPIDFSTENKDDIKQKNKFLRKRKFN